MHYWSTSRRFVQLFLGRVRWFPYICPNYPPFSLSYSPTWAITVKLVGGLMRQKDTLYESRCPPPSERWPVVARRWIKQSINRPWLLCRCADASLLQVWCRQMVRRKWEQKKSWGLSLSPAVYPAPSLLLRTFLRLHFPPDTSARWTSRCHSVFI